MQSDVILITPPVAEPITLAQAKLQCGFGPMEDYDHVKGQILSETLRPMITTARVKLENDLRRVFLTQTWLYTRDNFPTVAFEYERNAFPEILLPKPPFQSIAFFTYVDVAGAVQTLTQDTSYGTNTSFPQYGYQLVPGSETKPARLLPPWARPWPPTRMVPSGVNIQFKCGYGGPVTVSMAQGSGVLTGPTAFLPGDVGQAVSVPGAGASGAALTSTIASVASGVATLAAPAQTSVASVTAWVGQQVPTPILMAMKVLTQHYYENGCDDAPLPRLVETLVAPYRNMVS